MSSMHLPANHDRGQALEIYGWILCALSTIVVALRLYTRIVKVKRIAIDDYFIVLAWCCEVIRLSLLSSAVHYGLGRHAAYLQKVDLHHAVKFIVLLQGFAVATYTFGRIAFCLALIFIIGGTARWMRNVLITILVTQVILNSIVIIQIYAQCGSHLNALWNPVAGELYGSKCQAASVETNLGYAQSGVNSLTDLLLTFIPLVLVMKLQIPTATKPALAALLSLNLFAFIASILKGWQINVLNDTTDFTWSMAALQFCVCAESNVVICAASIPTLRPLFRSIAQKSSGDASRPNIYGNHGASGENTNGTGLQSGAYAEAKAPVAVVTTDGGSEEYILNDLDEEKIVRTTDVDITYEGARASGGGYSGSPV